ncbi:MAG: tyrosine protein phosphatase [Candidatus Sumerlaeota bacterium]|nr:tyrosine protein phosphatase [Candidatus Sumerlaeota bacterium]
MTSRVHWIDGLPNGRLGIAARPRGGDWLEDDVRAWRAAGVDMVVSLLTPTEVSEFGLEAEEAYCRRMGMDFLGLAIPDRGIPPAAHEFAQEAATLRDALDTGKSVAAHCRQGIGRSSLLVATVLVLAGEEPERAFERIETARGCPVPDTLEQRSWLRRFADTMRREAPTPRRIPAA